jgi:hypothetical protein
MSEKRVLNMYRQWLILNRNTERLSADVTRKAAGFLLLLVCCSMASTVLAEVVTVSKSQTHLEDYQTYDQPNTYVVDENPMARHKFKADRLEGKRGQEAVLVIQTEKTASPRPTVAPVVRSTPVKVSATSTPVTSTAKKTVAAKKADPSPAPTALPVIKRKSSFELPVPPPELSGVATGSDATMDSTPADVPVNSYAANAPGIQDSAVDSTGVEPRVFAEQSPGAVSDGADSTADMIKPHGSENPVTGDELMEILAGSVYQPAVSPIASETRHETSQVIKLLPPEQMKQLQSRQSVQRQEVVELQGSQSLGMVDGQDIGHQQAAKISYLPPEALESDRQFSAVKTTSVSANTPRGYASSEIVEVAPTPSGEQVTRAGSRTDSGMSRLPVSTVTSRGIIPTPASSLTFSRKTPVTETLTKDTATAAKVVPSVAAPPKDVPVDLPRWNPNRDLNNPGASAVKSRDSGVASKAEPVQKTVPDKQPASQPAPVKPVKADPGASRGVALSSTAISKQDSVMQIMTREGSGQVVYHSGQ